MIEKRQMKKGMVWALVLGSVLWGLDLSAMSKSKPEAAQKKSFRERMEELHGKELYQCTKDEDCGLGQATIPCPCSSGGSELAVSAKFVKEWNDEWMADVKSQKKAGLICPMVFKCVQKAVCVDSKCQIPENSEGAAASGRGAPGGARKPRL